MQSAITHRETLAIGIALSINNAGMGIGASFAGIHFLLTSLITLVLSFLFLITGNRLGSRLSSLQPLARSGDFLAGFIIVILGIFELFS